MIFATPPTTPLTDKDWRRINMRKVAHLLGAEMIHNLYGRYWPQINSIRFSNTKTTYKDGIVESYAPISEWSYLQRWVSEKFINLDPVILREVKAILQPTYPLTNELCELIDHTNLTSVSNSRLATLLIDIMDVPLGEIYKLNVVQIEYGLTFALDKLLQEYEPDKNERNRLLAKLISPSVLTIAQEEEVALGEVVRRAHRLKATGPENKEIRDLLQQHYVQFAGKHCAYGELPPDFSTYTDKLDFYLKSDQKIPSRRQAQQHVEKLHEKSQSLLKLLDDRRLTVLCNLMTNIGVFRDTNKARLGDTVLRRLALLDEVARRTTARRQDLDLYLLTDITNLLDKGDPLSTSELNKRKKGVTFVKEERLDLRFEGYEITQVAEKSDVLHGVCASPGIVNGIVKIITSHSDIDKMNEGDIMVAIGTDFDLIEIMHRASGIITEEGGLLSHASVVSRELKKPCLIGVAQATTKLKDGLKITLNATEGFIKSNE